MAKFNKEKLGKGLHALLANPKEEKAVSEEAGIKEVPLGQIEVNPFQPRNDFDQEALEELSVSIKTYGLIQPITVRKMGSDTYQIISGERRFRASKLAGLEKVPTYIRTANDQTLIEMALVENIQRADLNPIEIAISYQRLIDECQLTHEGLSDRVGKKRSTISNYVRLLKLPPAVQKALKKQMISMGHARALAGIEKPEMQLLALEEILRKDYSVRATEKYIQELQKPIIAGSIQASKALPIEYAAVQDRLRKRYATKIQIMMKGDEKGVIQIPFIDTEEFNRLFDLLQGDI